MAKIGREILSGLIFSKYDERTGPTPITWIPEKISPDVRSLVATKTLHFLSGEDAIIPSSIEIFPFPSKKLKGLVKFIQRKDESCRGGISNAVVSVLFKEEDDLIFYKSIKYFEELFDRAAKNIAIKGFSDLEVKRELEQLQESIIIVLNDLHEEEFKDRKAEAFPDIDSDKDLERTTFQYKIIVCGDPEVGKTSVILKFTDKAFRRTYIPTMGVNVSEKVVDFEKERVRFVIWDVAGQQKFQNLRKHFYSDASGIFLVCDLTRPETLEHLRDWHADIKNTLKRDLKGLILGNKKDLEGEVLINEKMLDNLGDELNLESLMTSALTGENINESFKKIGKMVLSEKLKARTT
ncbi:MAG: Rab family GTPase [Candidatus Hodarchaeota archaeon]